MRGDGMAGEYPRAPRPRLRPVASSTPTQLRWRRRIEAGLRLAAPALDLLLFAGDRLSRVVERDDLEWVPPRAAIPAGEPRPVR